MKDVVLFLQNRAARAGAQTSLARLVVADSIRALHPVVLLGSEGWLGKWCDQRGIQRITEIYPRSRPLQGRFWGNARFAARVNTQLSHKGLQPRVVIANDHQDGLLALAVASVCQAHTAVILRTSAMNDRHFHKYGCDRFDLVFAVGEQLFDRAKVWTDESRLRLYREHLLEEEFCQSKPWPLHFPQRVLVAGTENRGKGWSDVVLAIGMLEQRLPEFALECDFTGSQPSATQNDLHLEHRRRSRFRFLGHVEDFREIARGYDLVVHPSRHESFGLAPIEVLAAGVPLLCSRTGAIETVLKNNHYLFRPSNPADLADHLEFLVRNWGHAQMDIADAQHRIHALMNSEMTTDEFARTIGSLQA